MAENTPKDGEQVETQEHVGVSEGLPDSRGKRRSPWLWVPTVNFAQGMQYVVVTQLFGIIFFTMGMPKDLTLFWVGLLGLPWMFKPLWGPLVDRYWTKRNWTVFMQLTVGLGFLGSAFALLLPGEVNLLGTQGPIFFWLALIILLVLAFAAATHDIACDGYYMLALTQKQQAFYVGIRSTAFRFALIVANGGLLWAAGMVQNWTGPEPVYINVQSVVEDKRLDAPAIIEAAAPAHAEEMGLIVSEPDLYIPAGEPADVFVKLSHPPAEGEQVVLTPRFASGDKSISLHTERAVLDSSNWDKGTTISIHTSAQLKNTVSARFRVAAGDIPLSWALAIGATGALFILFFLLHSVVMPHPHKDMTETENRPPFIKPLFYLFVTVVLPFGLAYAAYQVIGRAPIDGMTITQRVAEATIGAEPAPATKKFFDFAWNFGRMLLIAGLFIFIIKVPPFSNWFRGFFRSMSDKSQIGFADVFETFFTKPHIGVIIAFLLTFRLGEVLVTAIKNIFLIDTLENGGVALTLNELGFANSFVYTGALIIGGLLGGWVIAHYGLKRAIWPMVLIMHIPNACFLWLAYEQPSNLLLINSAVAIESFGYGFGFTCYLLIMIMAAQGPYKTSHYALCTGIMALGALVPTMFSGFLAEIAGYEGFFIIVLLACLPGMMLIPFLPIDPNFGRKDNAT